MELELESSLGLVGSVSRVRLTESGPAPRSLDFGGSTAAAVESGELGERGVGSLPIAMTADNVALLFGLLQTVLIKWQDTKPRKECNKRRNTLLHVNPLQSLLFCSSACRARGAGQNYSRER